MRMTMQLAMLTLLAILAVGCAAVPAAHDDPLAGVPEDFSLELTVLHGRGVEKPSDVARRQGRFVVFPEGSLHHSDEIDDRRVRQAGFIRRLNREQQADLWLLLRQLNFSDPDRARPSMNLELIEPQPREILHQLAITAEGRRWVFVHRSVQDENVEPALRQLVEHLANLAWLPATPPSKRLVIPKRYYFGPDPYERYRR